MKIKIYIDNVSNKFNAFEDAIQFLQTANADIASSKLIKLLNNEVIKEWVKVHNNYLPLGYVVTSSYKGMTEVSDYPGEFQCFNECKFNISNTDIKSLNLILNDQDLEVICDTFAAICNTDADDWPSVRCFAVKFNAEFSSFELEEDSIERDC